MRDRASTAMALAFVLLVGRSARAPLASAAEDAEPGRQLYLKYCSACHGPQARGDGVVGPLMRPPAPDLTTLASRNGGEFPMEQVVRAIDGRQVPRAHGEPAMPVWGEILSQELGGGDRLRPPIERRVQGRIFLIADYLRTIQTR